jgi:hypothetical protein
MNVEKAYTLGCLSIHLQEDKNLDMRNMGLKLMAASDKQPKGVQQAFGAGRLDTAVAVSKHRARSAEKGGNRTAPKRKRS